MSIAPSLLRLKHRGPLATLSRLVATRLRPSAPVGVLHFRREDVSDRALHSLPPISLPQPPSQAMSPPTYNRLVCPGLNLTPEETPSDLYEKEVAFFNSIPWTAARLSTPGAIAFVPPCRNPITDVHDQLFGRTLANDRSITHMLCIFRAESPEAALDPTRTITETETLICAGDGVSGFPNVVHGGVVASMLDESMGALFDLNTTLGKSASAFKANNVTGKLDVSYHSPAPTNSVFRITVKVEEMNGRKTKFYCEMKDEKDTVLAKCSSTWLTVKPSL